MNDNVAPHVFPPVNARLLGNEFATSNLWLDETSVLHLQHLFRLPQEEEEIYQMYQTQKIVDMKNVLINMPLIFVNLKADLLNDTEAIIQHWHFVQPLMWEKRLMEHLLSALMVLRLKLIFNSN